MSEAISQGLDMDSTQDPKTYFHGRVMGSEEKNEEKEIKQVSYFGGGGLAVHTWCLLPYYYAHFIGEITDSMEGQSRLDRITQC